MYGRAKLDLLQARLIGAPVRGCGGPVPFVRDSIAPSP
jgi:hypothetical protein